MAYGQNSSKPSKPLNNRRLKDLSLYYLGRFATSKMKLRKYLDRKIKERGWDDEKQPHIDGLIAEFEHLGYLDDAQYAETRARSLQLRGYGPRRVSQDLKFQGIDESDGAIANEMSELEIWQAAHRFAKKRRIGPYSAILAEPDKAQKQLAAFLRAGHDFEIAKLFVKAAPGEQIGPPEYIEYFY
ncbi:hypothetical protein LPB140_11440 [Sphingorhabdus lutea]|uniref:Regulatory protein RecX n=1 Tax=Sphingorhabdus lutea TaxID=1913578 RepID=A0A1L3JDT5_9SPHN|nr:regulatory protein RecX [Sphingorhabdus lutea]APG63295.1 hypothetical protein LPB140_11440 [Sphingorhabdus lutea]